MATSFDTTMAKLGISRTGANANGPSRGLGDMNQADFIALMTAQMKNQDPFEPVDNTQMVAQLAQFSSLAGISEMGTTLKSIAEKLNKTGASEALAYVGKTVLTEGKTAYPRTIGGFAGAVELDAAATNVHLSIATANGEVVRTVDLGSHAAGTMEFDWDGTDNAGEPVEGGPFTITAMAKDGAATVGSRTLVWAPVTSVSMPSGSDPVLTLAGVGQIKPSAVRQVA
ncbi:flagellar hook assembly protein FlgD [Sphingomonas sp.]|uniref:flagellar hook assembly protein FlgD n=1 Tax=Sphingomonas sp. TaxID=28214 RepID=UPI002DD65B5F|nr:flagellar hook capping FlgD N-terminal domain-containing protein [Sphingomonas sp.]